jgi:hypothetical protein
VRPQLSSSSPALVGWKPQAPGGLAAAGPGDRDDHGGGDRRAIETGHPAGLRAETAASSLSSLLGLEACETTQHEMTRASIPSEAARHRHRNLGPADQGLEAALRAQASKASVPVLIESAGIGRYSRDAEAAVYFRVLEELQNAAKYAGAPDETTWPSHVTDTCSTCEQPSTTSVTRNPAGRSSQPVITTAGPPPGRRRVPPEAKPTGRSQACRRH